MYLWMYSYPFLSLDVVFYADLATLRLFVKVTMIQVRIEITLNYLFIVKSLYVVIFCPYLLKSYTHSGEIRIKHLISLNKQ